MGNDLGESERRIRVVDTELSFDLQKAWRSSFYQALQLVRCFDFDPGSPTAAAIFSMLFQRLKLRASLKRLHSWLYDYISPFATGAPRDQTDQREKMLAIAIYLCLSYQNGLDIHLPEGRLIDYIEYARRQSWLEDPFLAFCCNSLKSKQQVSRDVDAYFTANFERFLARQHIPAVCQTLLILDTQLSKVNQERGYEMVCHALSNHDVSLSHAAWGLMALSRPTSIDAYQSTAEHLAKLIDVRLMGYLSELVRESRLPSLLALIWSGAEQTDLHRYLKAFPTSEYGSLVNADLDSPGSVRLSFNVLGRSGELANSDVNWPSLAEVGLALTAIHIAGKHNLIGVIETEEARLVFSLQKAQKLEREGSVVLSRSENIVGNLLAIVITFGLGLALVLYFLGARFHFVLDLSQVSWRDFDVFVWTAVWVDYIAAQIQTLCSGGSAISGMLKIPLVRHIPAALQGLRGLAGRTGKE